MNTSTLHRHVLNYPKSAAAAASIVALTSTCCWLSYPSSSSRPLHPNEVPVSRKKRPCCSNFGHDEAPSQRPRSYAFSFCRTSSSLDACKTDTTWNQYAWKQWEGEATSHNEVAWQTKKPYYSYCEAPSQPRQQSSVTSTRSSSSSSSSSLDINNNTKISNPSWMRWTLYRLGVIRTLPLPRRVNLRDPALQVPSGLLRQRAVDEQRLPQLQQRLAAAVQAGNVETAQGLVTAVYETLYGVGITPQIRTDFLIRYGCTAWNDDILNALVRLADGRGMVEIGAGHGQWARALEDRRRQQSSQQPKSQLAHPQTLVRAYDNQSQLPLNPAVYHAGTAVAARHFGTVRPCPDVPSVLAAFENRHRILLLVYPTADLAAEALQAFQGDTVVYVGEGMGGANAGEAFFEQLLLAEDEHKWYLVDVMPGVPCGTKGGEKVFIFQKGTVA